MWAWNFMATTVKKQEIYGSLLNHMVLSLNKFTFYCFLLLLCCQQLVASANLMSLTFVSFLPMAFKILKFLL